ncbi:DUF7287 family protein [Halopenitus persicus]|uniref:DUF7287 family protein n=1 Tax=Halopenitus persicus TaxID=1048396 RepID=UPI000BBA93A2|nr:hypothetical protein [Halopenitus persicus]
MIRPPDQSEDGSRTSADDTVDTPGDDTVGTPGDDTVDTPGDDTVGTFADDTRGQTLPDFAAGIAIFLITVTFVSVFVPQLILPFEDQEQPVVADRITNGLGNDALTEPGTPSELNESATRAFFDLAEDEALDRLGVRPWYSVNVTIRDVPSHDPDSAVLCAVDDPDSDEWIGACESGADRFALGPPASTDDRSVSTARRALFAGDSGVVLEVRVW